MSHNHHDYCGHDSHDHHHEHNPEGQLGPQDNLYQHIDRPNVVALNTEEQGSIIIKPWDQRLDETKSLKSDADDQMCAELFVPSPEDLIVRIPFTGSVRLRSLLLKTGPGDETPSRVLLYANAPSLDFDDVAHKTATQECNIPQGREIGEYPLKTAKFSNISSVTLFFPSSQGAETSQIYYVGFLGHWSQHKNNPVITVYEAQANLADHEKIQGMDGAFSTPHT